MNSKAYKKDMESTRQYAYNFLLKKENDSNALLKSGLQQVNAKNFKDHESSELLKQESKDSEYQSLQRNYENLSDLMKAEKIKFNSLQKEMESYLKENTQLREQIKFLNIKIDELTTSNSKNRIQLAQSQEALERLNKEKASKETKTDKKNDKQEKENRSLKIELEKYKADNSKLKEGLLESKKTIAISEERLKNTIVSLARMN